VDDVKKLTRHEKLTSWVRGYEPISQNNIPIIIVYTAVWLKKNINFVIDLI